ncbi:hypothetical protein BH23PLA1_BH23PLA1_23570 [soil metagenome]
MMHGAWILTLTIGTLAPTDDDVARLQVDREAILTREIEQLTAMADRLRDEGRIEEAEAVRSRIEPASPPDGPSRFVPLDELVLETEGPAKNLHEEAQQIQQEAAGHWFDLATEALDAGQYALADACLRRVLARQDNHAEARRLLGFEPFEEGWATSYAVKLLKSGQVRHETFGWVPAAWVPRLESGQLPSPSKPGQRGDSWMPAEQADALRQGDFQAAWQIETPHFLMRANVPLAEGIDFGRRLEDFHEAFTAIMGDVIGPDRLPLARRHRRPEAAILPRSTREKHQVSYFSTKDQYVEHLHPWQGPEIARSLGVYIDPETARKRRQPPRSYFYNDQEGQLAVTETLYHEVSHQLLFELPGPSAFGRNVGNFWVFEGLGTYFETVRPQSDGSLEIGGLVGVRIAEAKHRILERGEYIPLADLVALDRPGFDGAGGDPYLHYAQSMALTVFLMDHDHARFREPFLEYVRDAYQGRLRPTSGTTLSERLGVSYQELDRQLQMFLR